MVKIQRVLLQKTTTSFNSLHELESKSSNLRYLLASLPKSITSSKKKKINK